MLIEDFFFFFKSFFYLKPKSNPLNQIHQIVIAFNKLVKVHFAVLVLVHELHLLLHKLVQVDPGPDAKTREQVFELFEVQVPGLVPVELRKNELCVHKSSLRELNVVRFLCL